MIKKAIYGGVGLSMTLLIVGYLLTEKPDAYIPQIQTSTMAKEDTYDYDEFEQEIRDYGESGDFEMPAIFETYHISATDIAKYEKEKILEVGRENPMLFKKQESKDYSSGASYTWEDVLDSTPVEYGHALGYDINATSQGGDEIKSIETSSIEEKFAHYAVYPVEEKYYNFTSQFGPRIDPIAKDKEVFHGGVDISQAGIDGQDIFSVLPGAVSHIGYNERGYGHFVVVNHGDFTTLYAHMKEAPTVSVGDEVRAGDKIGIIGSTGRSTGPHLHFEVSKGSVLIDPKPLLDSISTGKPAKPQTIKEVEELEEKNEEDTQAIDPFTALFEVIFGTLNKGINEDINKEINEEIKDEIKDELEIETTKEELEPETTKEEGDK